MKRADWAMRTGNPRQESAGKLPISDPYRMDTELETDLQREILKQEYSVEKEQWAGAPCQRRPRSKIKTQSDTPGSGWSQRPEESFRGEGW
jgi:hypothetical protein